MTTWIGPSLTALVVALAGTRLLIRVLRVRGVLDVPNARSSHAAPTPRGGGIAILAGTGVAGGAAALLGMPLPGAGFWAGAAVVAVTGWADDRTGGLSPALRLLLQIAAAVLALLGTGGLTALPLPPPADVALGALAWPLAVLWIVAVTNIYNFLDGIDGYAASQGVLAGLVLLGLAGTEPVLGLGGLVAGACVGFGVYNWHRARIFMGDVGSGTLGFVFAALPFQAAEAAPSGPVFVVALALWFFLADGTYTLLWRAVRGERIWEAHRSHLYQRLVQTRLRHDAVVLRVGAAAIPVAVAGSLAWQAADARAQWIVLLCGSIAFFALVGYTRWRERAMIKLHEGVHRTVS